MSNSSSPLAITGHRPEFLGKGREYAQLCLLTALATVGTLGLCFPWAWQRQRSYLGSRTLLAGSQFECRSPGFRKILAAFFAFLLILGFTAEKLLGENWAIAALVLSGAAGFPYFWALKRRVEFRSLRWRGIRVDFDANLVAIYRKSLPVLGLALTWLGVLLAMQVAAPAADPAQTPWITLHLIGELADGDLFVGALALLGIALSLPCLMRLEFNYTMLLTGSLRIGGKAVRSRLDYPDFIKIWQATIGVFAACGIPLSLLVHFSLHHFNLGGQVAGVVGVAFFSCLPALAYHEARSFKLLWGGLGLGGNLRITCNLKPATFVQLRMIDLTLTLLTLGAYQPFAKLRNYRAKIQSLTVHVKGCLDTHAMELSTVRGRQIHPPWTGNPSRRGALA
ncbi:MAG: DUF898 family protein [Pseudomonadota bacterium]